MRRAAPAMERILARSVEAPCLIKGLVGSCLVWTGALSDGYGHIWEVDRVQRVHRLAYVELVGPIPDELKLDHLCRRRPCWNPNHLEPVSDRVNILRGVAPAARNARAIACPAGHAYTSETTYHYPSGSRACRICMRELKRLWKQRKRAAA